MAINAIQVTNTETLEQLRGHPTADRTITFPDATGTVLMTGSTIDLGDDSGI